jgi:CopG family nickel-responsive transcriptional regulator
MPVISVSLSEENLEFLDKIQDTYKLKGRSDAVRTSINSAISEMQDMENMSGNVEGILITVRHDHADPWMGIIQAKYINCIKTQIHTHLRDKKCLEVMVVSCDADELKDIMQEIKASGKADYVRFVRS